MSYEVCGATNRQAGQVDQHGHRVFPTCQMPAGWGTDHVGYGYCRRHNGNCQSHREAAARQIAKEEMEQLLSRYYGHEVAILPWDALILAVRLAAGRVEIAASKMRDLPEGSKEWVAYTQLHNQAIEQLVRYSKTALDAGVEERLVNLAERQGQQHAEVFTSLMDELDLTDEQRAALPDAIEKVLRPLESDPLLPSAVTVDGNAREVE
jgi:hypothetical protein